MQLVYYELWNNKHLNCRRNATHTKHLQDYMDVIEQGASLLFGFDLE